MGLTLHPDNHLFKPCLIDEQIEVYMDVMVQYNLQLVNFYNYLLADQG